MELTNAQRRMLKLLADHERVVTRELSERMECTDEELLLEAVAVPLCEDGLARLCLNISGGPNWYEITPRGRELLRAGDG